MRISIRHNNTYIIEFSQFVIHGRLAAGGYAFTVSMRGGRQASGRPFTIFDINLAISLADLSNPLLLSIPSSSRMVECTIYPNNNEQVSFEFILDKMQINAIEEYRQDRDLKLNISLRALMTSTDALLSSFDATDIVVPRESWLKALENSGFRKTILFEVPLPSVPDYISSLISNAQEFIEIGHYKQAVTQCRLIIERIETLRNDKRSSVEAVRKTKDQKEREGMTPIERMLATRETLKSICHLGPHGSEQFTRSQAKAVLAMTLSLLAEPTVGFHESLTSDEEKIGE